MSKRKKRRATNSTGTGPTSPEQEASGHNTGSKRSRQTLLLLVAVVLLSGTAYINLQRAQQSQLPDTLPLPTTAISNQPLAEPSRSFHRESASSTRFTLLSPAQTGVDFTHPVLPDHPMAFLYFSSMASGGTAVGDVDGDGRPDLFIASGPKENRLYVQTETAFKFEDISVEAGIGGGDAWACGATMVDINADGRLDIYVANYDSPNALYINLGNGKFKDMAWEYGLNLTNASLEGTFADYDRDGDLDMYLVNYRFENPKGMPEQPPIEVRNGQEQITEGFEKYYEITNDSIGYGTVGRSDGLLKNMGTGEFQDVSTEAGIHGAGHGQSATWWDFNDDGFPDLFVGNDFNDPDNLYRNNGDGTFTDVIRDSVPHTTWFSMGSDAGDLDGNGLPDLLTADMSSTTHFKQKTTMGSMGNNIEFLTSAMPRQYMRNALLLNTGTPRFKEAAYLANLDSTDWTWSVKLADFDCDGKLDVFFTNGSVRSFTDSDRTLTLSQRKGNTEWDLYKDTDPLRETNLAFRNLGGLQFENVSESWGLDHLGVSMSSAHADFDGDGDLDLVVANVDEPLAIYRNDTSSANRLTIRLHGNGGNRFGIGTKVTVSRGEMRQTRELQPSRGFLASNEPLIHFGLGDVDSVDVTIRWPEGGIQKHDNLAANQHYEIKQQDDLARPKNDGVSTPLFMTETATASDTAHQESDFDDFQLQPLLPHRMSRLGPSIASADVDSDGVLDYFIGGAAGQPGRIVTTVQGRLEVLPQPALQADGQAEDMGAVWFDLEQDGDPDLVVVGGGNEFAIDSEYYAVRLYVNNAGKLQRNRELIPNIRVSGGPISAADFDADGDVDLFIGGRQIPGKYPLPPNSYLLVNDDGVLRDATQSIIAGGGDLGMVTGSVWTDVDNDNDLDLLITTEWDSIRLLRNDGGRLHDDSSLAGLTGYRGWWTGITAADLDNDGDVDYVATNLGLNTKYHATDEHPFRLFYGDFEGKGQRRLVEAEYENDTLFPVRGKSCSTHAIPSLGGKFATYKAFAAATLEDIYTAECLEDSYECSANWLASVALINDGTGHFAVSELPFEAQLSPSFGCAIVHCNDDDIPDLFLAQNFFSPQPETGNMDGGLSCLLAGLPNGGFRPISTASSGIVIPADAKSAVLTEINGDGLADFIVATNDDQLRLIKSQRFAGSLETVQVHLNAASTATFAGAKLTFKAEGLSSQMCEVSAGSGYLSQHAPVFFFKRPKGSGATLLVRRPDGSQTTTPVAVSTTTVRIPQVAKTRRK